MTLRTDASRAPSTQRVTGVNWGLKLVGNERKGGGEEMEVLPSQNPRQQPHRYEHWLPRHQPSWMPQQRCNNKRQHGTAYSSGIEKIEISFGGRERWCRVRVHVRVRVGEGEKREEENTCKFCMRSDLTLFVTRTFFLIYNFLQFGRSREGETVFNFFL